MRTQLLDTNCSKYSLNNQCTDTLLSITCRIISITIAENDPHEGKRKIEALWPIFRLHHQRSRYVYELYYKREAISKELYEYLLKQGYADANLIAKWKKVHILRDHLNKHRHLVDLSVPAHSPWINGLR